MYNERKVKIILHGYLKGLYEGVIELSGTSVAEIINGFCKQTKAFDVNAGEDRHIISVVGFDTEELIRNPLPNEVTELHLVPAMVGGKNGGFFKVVLGAVIIAATILTYGTAAAALQATWGALFFNLGVSLVLGGLLEMVSPAPKIEQNGDSASDPEAS